MNKPFYLMNNGYYLNYEENCSSALKISNIICSEEKKHSWIFSGNKLQNNETKGYLTKKYHGWTPDLSNILLQNKHDYDIEIKSLEWKYLNEELTTTIDGIEYILCKSIDSHNIIIKRHNSDFYLLDTKWKQEY